MDNGLAVPNDPESGTVDLSQNNDAELKEPKENRGYMIEWFYLYTTLEDENAARVTTLAKTPKGCRRVTDAGWDLGTCMTLMVVLLKTDPATH